MKCYKPYPTYKTTGVDWLGFVPEHWVSKKLMYWISTGYGSGTTPSEESHYEHEESGIAWVTTGELRENIINKTQKYVTERALYEHSALKIHPLGSLIIAMYGATIGRLGVLEVEATVNQACFAIHPCEVISTKFLKYWFEGFRNELIELGTGGGQPNISGDKIRNLLIAAPSSLDEQKFIAEYLDCETARIVALVEKKTRFIELLREKRQALITQAVTKGLNLNVPMKDSGVEWLGKVPVHWEIRPIKGVVDIPITDGPHETPNFIGEGVPFVSAEAVSRGFLNFEKIRGYISREDHQRFSKKYQPRRNDIYMVKSGATTGVTAIVDTDQEFNIWSPLAVIRCCNKMDPYFVLNFMRSRSFLEAVALNWSFGTQQNIGMGVIGNLQVTVPPLVEQEEISQSLKAMVGRIDEVVAKTERSIELLKERRLSLITAAVTGQIDLREAA